MANEEHLKVLQQGAAIWNEWRERNRDEKPDLSEADFSRTDLSGANLSAANLYRAVLSGADLSESDLRRANLTGAVLISANLRRADLNSAELVAANLSSANLRQANLSEANLNSAQLVAANLDSANLGEANFTQAVLMYTIFANVDLGKTDGLDDCFHARPSVVDFRTLTLSQNLPRSFLRGCGLPDNFIDYLPSLRDEAIQFYSCFISYSSRDQVFADKLHADLQNKGIRCWFAPHDLPIGAKTWDAIDEAIRLRDKLLLILSKFSIESEWVEDEVNKAYAEERSRRGVVLFPIRIDDTLMSTAEPWAVKLRDQRNIGDFRRWKKPEAYQKSLDRLLRDLKANTAK
jgi:uncharacterized protein YjbI with pentapeptide repeats